jgi:hypothetical protein
MVGILNNELIRAGTNTEEAKTARFQLRLEPGLLQQINEYRRAVGGLSRSTAIRQLIARGLNSNEEVPPVSSDDSQVMLLLLCDVIDHLGVKTGIDLALLRAGIPGRPAGAIDRSAVRSRRLRK